MSGSRLSLLGVNNLRGTGDGMHVNVQRNYAYVGHQGFTTAGTSIVDVSDPTEPRLLTQIERPAGTHSHKVQVLDDILLVNHERNNADGNPASWSAGLAIYDISRPHSPQQVGFFETPGTGVHRMTYWEEPYAFVSASADGYLGRILLIVDLSDPSRPTEVGRWWFPGQHGAGGETPTWRPPSGRQPGPGEKAVMIHHGVPDGSRLYCGWWDAGFVSLDVSDPESPSLVAHLDFGPESTKTHTALPLPGRNIVIVTDEARVEDFRPTQKVRVLDISDEHRPVVIAELPAPTTERTETGSRIGPHNLHEHRPGSLVDPQTIFLTYFAGGIRVYDLKEPRNPVESAHFVPEPPWRVPNAPQSAMRAIQFNDVTVTNAGHVYVTDRFGGGLYILELEERTGDLGHA